MTHEKRVTRGSGQHDQIVVFFWPAGRIHASGSRTRHLKHLPLSYPNTYLVPILNKTPLVSFSKSESPTNPHTHAPIHPYPLQPGRISLPGTRMTIKLFFKCRPTSPIRGSSMPVMMNGLAGHGDPTRIKPVSHRSIGRRRVESGRVRTFSNITRSGLLSLLYRSTAEHDTAIVL